jgi:hypothetical protein
MSTTTDRQAARPGDARKAPTASLTTDRVWRVLAKASFAVVSHVTPAGKPRSSGVVFAAVGRRLFLATAVDSWKSRHITSGAQVAVTVPVRRGGIMSLLMPIPPATISFHASAVVHPAGWLDARALPRQLVRLLPPERRNAGRIIELRPVGDFVTYGLGVSLMTMRNPALARGRVPVA